MDSPLDSIRATDFSADAHRNGQQMQVSLSGTADLTVRAQLDRFLRNLHAEVQRLSLREVNVDVRRLEFMNSACLKSLVWWIGTVQEQEPDERYRIVFVSSPTVYWQRRSLNALACLAGEIVTVEA